MCLLQKTFLAAFDVLLTPYTTDLLETSDKGAEKIGFQGPCLNVIDFQNYLAQILFTFSGTICRHEKLVLKIFSFRHQ